MKRNKVIAIPLLIVISFIPLISLGLFYKPKENNVSVEKPIVVVQESKTIDFVPWSTNSEGLTIIESALKNTDTYFSNVTPNSSYDINVDKSFPSSEITWIKEMLSFTNGSFPVLKNNSIKVFVSGSGEWAKKTLENERLWVGNPNSKYPCDSFATSEGSCANDNIILLSYYDVQENQDWYVQRRSIPAHELFHIVQDYLSEMSLNLGPDHPKAIPTWLIEGSANYYGFYVVNKMGFNNYKESRSSRSWYDYKSGPQVPLIEYNNFSSDPYIIGQLATEYLVASAGFEGLMNIFKLSKTEKTFSSAFKKAVGLSLDEFYLKFELSRSLMYVG
jgi:hypothetical protein